MNKKLVIAIDGPVGSGKGTLAIALAKKLNALHIYTGGMYRALALACLKENVDFQNEEKVLGILGKSSIELKVSSNGTQVFLDGQDVTDEIFLPKVSNVVPIIAAYPSVRKEMVIRQKELIENESVVIEGRDIATDVSPNADFKVFITADIKTRTKRRLIQLEKRGIKTTFDEVQADVQRRDEMDKDRQTSPLVIAPDAYVLDTSNLTIEETVDKALNELRKRHIIDD